MSFNDLEAGFGGGLKSNQNSDALTKSISQKIFKITSNVSNLQRIVNLLGTQRDTQALRSQMHDVTESTREMIKVTTKDIKSLTTNTSSLSSEELKQRKLGQHKLTKDFQKVLAQFHSIQKISAEKSREVVDYIHNVQEDEEKEEQPLLLQSNQRVQVQSLDNEIEFNQGLIEEREREIQEIEQGITELNEVFRDLGTFVNEQQGLLDNIESNVSNVAVNIYQANTELNTANEYQKKSRKTMCYIFLILFVVLSIFILVIFS
ncbi:t-SNARE [Neoconidiobolus thromboides FSU 785]|nr:t-SNARE [Neoconidiobolus thromboides FSU 785]